MSFITEEDRKAIKEIYSIPTSELNIIYSDKYFCIESFPDLKNKDEILRILKELNKCLSKNKYKEEDIENLKKDYDFLNFLCRVQKYILDKNPEKLTKHQKTIEKLYTKYKENSIYKCLKQTLINVDIKF